MKGISYLNMYKKNKEFIVTIIILDIIWNVL